ncbi:tubulin glycylase 3A-like [Culicoides brevitarsis]|uniref:tubulin glycylase 3A-like n=1 Tax=Culicoides brevitarsis TaxID=469753 RepID=UPI00307C615C
MATAVELRPTPKRRLSKTELDKLKIRYQELERRVDAAIKEGKIFKVVGGWNVPQIKYHLAKRGYIEVIDNPFRNSTTKISDMALLEKSEDCNIYEQALLSKMLGIRRPKFVWTEQPHFYVPYNFATMMNKTHVEDMEFWVKDGLCKAVQKINRRAKKHCDALNCPRSYNLSVKEQIEEFKNDFRLTVATNLILYLNACSDILVHFAKNDDNDAEIDDDTPRIDHGVLDYAFKIVLEHVEALTETTRSNDVYDENPYLNETDEFFDLSEAYRHICIEKRGKFVIYDEETARIDDYILGIMSVAETIGRYWPWRHHDGLKNIWLVKPTSSGEGQGIKLFNDPAKIMEHVEARPVEKFIVQKYIERPLLIYNTKFDLRQYLLVSIDSENFYAWSHPVCSVKLASQEFNLDNFDESIHLTNASIQQKYWHQNSNENLPNHHM